MTTVFLPGTTSMHVAVVPAPGAEDQAHQPEEQEDEQDKPEDTTEREEANNLMAPTGKSASSKQVII